MDTNDETLEQIRRLLELAIDRVNKLDDTSRDAFTQAARTLDGTATEYQRTVMRQADLAHQSIDEALRSLTAAIGLVDDLIRSQDT